MTATTLKIQMIKRAYMDLFRAWVGVVAKALRY